MPDVSRVDDLMLRFQAWGRHPADAGVARRRVDAVSALGFPVTVFHDTVARLRREGRSLEDAVHGAVEALT